LRESPKLPSYAVMRIVKKGIQRNLPFHVPAAEFHVPAVE
jgi:hypothetical protein